MNIFTDRKIRLLENAKKSLKRNATIAKMVILIFTFLNADTLKKTFIQVQLNKIYVKYTRLIT